MTVTLSLREELIFLLTEATELEHSLCCSYLFTAMSLKSSTADGLSPEAVEAVHRWKQVFNGVAIEEMFHLAVINQLLVAVGGAPHFDRPNFPHGCSYYMPDLHIGLRPFDEETLRHFVAVEQPTGGELPLLQNPALAAKVLGNLQNEIGADPHLLASQGDVYDLALAGLEAMVARMGAEKVFIGPPPTAAMTEFLRSSGWEPIVDLATAEQAMAKIVEEGEGGAGDSLESHYHRFSRVLEEYLEWKARDPSFEPAFPVLHDPFPRTPPEPSGPVNLIDDGFAIQLSDLFNEVYTAMLHLLSRFYVTNEETEEESWALIDAAIQAMGAALIPLGELLARTPAGPSHPDMNAGASFTVRTLPVLPFKSAAWALLRERFEELRAYAERLAERDARLQPVAGALGAVVKKLS